MTLGRLGIDSLFLAATDPLDHVVDAPFGEEAFWANETVEEVFATLGRFGLTKHAFLFILAGLLTLLFFWIAARSATKRTVPGRWGLFIEFIIDFVRDQMVRPFMGEHGDRYVPLIVAFFVYIAIANVLGLIPFFDFLGHGGNTATASLAVTAGLAVVAFVFYHLFGVREQGGFWIYLKRQVPHVPIFVLPIIIPVELIAHAIRPCALAVRLFANMLAGHTMMAALLGFTLYLTRENPWMGGGVTLVSVLGATALTFLELLVALIQAFVFAFLTTVFLSLSVHPEH